MVTLATVVVAAIIATVVVVRRRPHDLLPPEEEEAQAVNYPEGQGSEEIPYSLNASDLVLVDGPGFTSRGSCNVKSVNIDDEVLNYYLRGNPQDMGSTCRRYPDAVCNWIALDAEEAVEDWLEDNYPDFDVRSCDAVQSRTWSESISGSPYLLKNSCVSSSGCNTRCTVRCTIQWDCRVC